MQLLEELLEQIKATDLNDLDHQPNSRLEEGEEVLGVLSEDLQKVYIFFCKTAEELRQDCERVHGNSHEDDNLEVNEHILKHVYVGLVRDVFWLGVHKAFPKVLVPEEGLAIRIGWRLVRRPSLKKEKKEEFAAFLSAAILGIIS